MTVIKSPDHLFFTTSGMTGIPMLIEGKPQNEAWDMDTDMRLAFKTLLSGITRSSPGGLAVRG